MSTRVLLTGGTGFVGSAILRELLAAGHTVSVLSRSATMSPVPGARLVRGDLSDRAGLLEATRGAEVVVHAANIATSTRPDAFVEVNVQGTAHLCEAASANGVRRMICISTAGVYGHRPHRGTTENQPCAADTPFSRSKRKAETIVLQHHAAGDFRAIILRPRFVYGPGDRSVIPGLLKALRKFPLLLGGGSNRLSFVSADALAAVARAFVHPVEPSGESPVFNVTEEEPLTYAELAQLLGREFGVPPPKRSVPFMALYGPVKAAELLLRLDPERSWLPLSSIRLKLFGRDNHFSSDKLRRALPELRMGDLRCGFTPETAAFYRQLAGTS